ncbi:SusC/RagA family TonB-linked outer membrane protein [Bacteroides bouchesdurhonensis]|uniref:SusC/RagA family TonB-linked outer membrane protein n=1 Tax=Bacteroides bouchesdurhonensis TaxID=1841855 RepID=UPI00097F76F4|nr:TonB-dependent receptor [Bacteroides bouchesdurhonensis]
MRNFLLTCILLLGLSVSALAQENVTVTGTVLDTNKEPMIGVNVSIENMPGLGAITDLNGKYSIKMPPYNKLVFSYIGYDKVTVLIKEQKVVNVTMQESSATVMDEVVVTGTGTQKKIAVTGAITNVDVEQLKSNPSSSVVDALAGVVPGVMAMQSDGRPGTVSEFWVRGISTFGASSAALVLVDGFERDINEVSVEDIESFTVLKDASATAIYGSKGANGVVLITTKRGKEGKINVDVKLEGFYSTFTQKYDFVDGHTYASMANEAKTTRNQEPLYSHEELEMFRLGLDPDLFPNVDWMDVMMRDGAFSSRATVNMSGGGKTARYFVSGSYQDQQGMYKVDNEMKKDYNTNTNFRKWTYRMNIDIDITKSTLLKVGVSGSLRKQNDPGQGTTSIWTALMGYNAITTPITYSDGRIPAIGNDNGDRFNPWVQATQTGFNESWKNNIQTNITLEQKLDFITKGLRFVGRFGYDTENSNYIKRYKYPELWRAERYRNSEGDLVFTKIVDEKKLEQASGSSGERHEFFEWELHYDRGFKAHHVGGVLKYTQSSKVQTQGIGTDIKNGIARRNQGLAGQATYNWNYRYFVNFNFGYTGSENFHKDHRYGFFPAVSAAWNIAEEPFIKKQTKEWLNMLKVRYSYGKTGNDNLNGIRFPYLFDIETITKTVDNKQEPDGGYWFSDINANVNRYYGGMRYSSIASLDTSWEIATKQDLGVDIHLFDDKFTAEIDYFHEKRSDIYWDRKYLPWIVGLEQTFKANIGEVKTKGFDGHFSFRQKIKNVDVTLRGNMTYSKNEIIEQDEENTVYGYKLNQGHRIDQAKGLVALGLFKDYDDIRNSPRQTWNEVMPGDIKYKDINGDGIIDGNDRVAIGATKRPNLTYGFGTSVRWKQLDVNVLFQGVGKSTYFIDGSTVFMFRTGDGWGNILTEMANSNRWILGENEDPNAEYPRLTYGKNENNEQQSTYWLRNGAYLRLKNLDIGYTLPTALANKAHLNRVRFYFIATNLLTFSKFKLWDPEMGSTDGKKYPLSKTFTLGVSVNL